MVDDVDGRVGRLHVPADDLGLVVDGEILAGASNGDRLRVERLVGSGSSVGAIRPLTTCKVKMSVSLDLLASARANVSLFTLSKAALLGANSVMSSVLFNVSTSPAS